MPTPHNTAKIEDIAKTVLMPGDPLRAKYIAEHYLENPVLFNDVRNMLGYTGTYEGKEVSVMGKFVIRPVKSGIMFNLKAGNGEVIATSEAYTTEAACMKGIESVRNNCVGEIEDQTVENFEVLKHPKYEVYTDKAGEFRFRLKAKNGEIIATSEGYKAKASAMNGIDSIKRNAPDAKIEKLEA